MEYYQMTITDWISMKQKLQAELMGVRRSFVRIGYILRKIDESKGYENDGYKSIAEWARGEYGLEGSTVSRFMSINREYSVGGFSEDLLPEYEDFKRSQLEEMLKLPMEDREMIRPETARQDIRDLKQFNKQTPAAGEADDIHQLVQKFFAENSDTLKEVYEVLGNTDAMKEVVNPSGNRSYRKGVFFLMMYEDGIKLKKFGGSPETYTWQQFFTVMTDIYGMELEKGEEKTDEGRDAETENNEGADGRKSEMAGREDPGDGETAAESKGKTEVEAADASENNDCAGAKEKLKTEEENERRDDIGGIETDSDGRNNDRNGYTEPETTEQRGCETINEGNSEDIRERGRGEENNQSDKRTIQITGGIDKSGTAAGGERSNKTDRTDTEPEGKKAAGKAKNEEKTEIEKVMPKPKPVKKTTSRYTYMQALSPSKLAEYLYHNMRPEQLTGDKRDLEEWMMDVVDEWGVTF